VPTRLAIVLALLLLAGAAVAHADVASDSLIHADATRAAGYTGAGTIVAILDTGVDSRDPAVVAEHCFVAPDGCPDGTGEQDGPGSAQDDQGHGTAMENVVRGVAPGASIVGVKVADRNGRTSTAQIMAGLAWVLKTHPEVKVVNVSLGSDVMLSGDCSTLTPTFRAYTALVDSLRANGTTVFASSGNGGSRASMTAPACIHDVVAVGAVYTRSIGTFTAPFVCRDDTTAADEIACFSNSSTELDLLAAGDVDPLAGTSVAAAQVSGAAAVLLAAEPALTPDSLLSLLESTGLPILDVRNDIATPRIDLAAAVAHATGHPVPLLPPPPGSGPPVAAPHLSQPTVPRLAVSRTGTRRFRIRNSGTGYLTVRVAISPAAFSVRPAKLTIAAGRARTVTVGFHPRRPGVYRGRLTLESDDPSLRRVTYAVNGTATP
jgi:subtilisin family serine protease